MGCCPHAHAVSQGPAISGHCPFSERSWVPGRLARARGCSVVNVFSFAGRGASSNFLNLVAESQKRPQYVNEQMWLCSRSFIYKELGARCGAEAMVGGVGRRQQGGRRAAEAAFFPEGHVGTRWCPLLPCTGCSLGR